VFSSLIDGINELVYVVRFYASEDQDER